MQLPKEKTTPKDSLKDFPILLYGRAKVGKTTLAAQFEDPLFLMLEPGAKSLSIFQIEVLTWKKFVEAIKLLEEDRSKFQTVVMDTVDRAYELCMESVCEDLGISHPQEQPYGQGWKAVDVEFINTMTRLQQTGRGIIYTSHYVEKEVEQLDGTVKTMTAPSLAKQGMKFIDRCVDLYAYYYYEEDGTRWIRVKGNGSVVAGSRINGHFEGIAKFSAGSSPKDAYEQFVRAFNNQKDGEVAVKSKMKFKIK